MKTERRHELQKNELADWLAAKLTHAQKYSGAIGASVLAIVVLVAVGMYMSRRSANQTAVAWEELFNASDASTPEQLQNLADKMANTDAGKWARLRLADRALDQGIEQLFKDRAEASKSLATSVEGYRWVVEHAGDPLLEERATLGLAKAYESQDKLPEARQSYEKLLKRWPEGVYASEAKGRLRDLDKKSTREFYDWFAARDIKPPVGEPGTPGLKPKFDSSSLPADGPEIKFQHAQQPKGDQPASGAGPSLSTPIKQFDEMRSKTVQPDATPADASPPAAASTPAKTPAKQDATPAATQKKSSGDDSE